MSETPDLMAALRDSLDSAREARQNARKTYGFDGWTDKHGDVWHLGEEGLLHAPETRPFPPAYVEKKWGPLRKVVVPTRAAQRDADRVRNETRDRLDKCDSSDFHDALRWLGHNHPDLVNEALNEIGAPA